MKIDLKVNNNVFEMPKVEGYDIYVNDQPMYIYDEFFMEYDHEEQLSITVDHKRRRIYVINIDALDTEDNKSKLMEELTQVLINDRESMQIKGYTLYYPGGDKIEVLI